MTKGVDSESFISHSVNVEAEAARREGALAVGQAYIQYLTVMWRSFLKPFITGCNLLLGKQTRKLSNGYIWPNRAEQTDK